MHHLNLVSYLFRTWHAVNRLEYDDGPQSDSRSAKYGGSNGPWWSITATQFYVSAFNLFIENH